MTPLDLPRLVNADPVLRRWGRVLNADVLLAIGPEEWLLHLHQGVVDTVRQGPFLMPSFTVALRFDEDAWAQFLLPDPPPGRHDLMAMVRGGTLRLQGDLHPFFSHLLWFKAAFASLRGPVEAAA